MTFVLLHGAWHGGWCWQRVAALLRAQGAQVLAPTLRGLAERAHEMSAAITLATHVADVTDLLQAEELRDVTLVGHSYAGLVIAGVADREPERIRRLVFFDAVVVENGQRWCDTHPPEEAAARLARARSTAGGGIPPPDAARMGLDSDADVAMVRARLTPQPVGTYTSPLQLRAPLGNGLPKVYVDCRNPALPGLKPTKEKLRAAPGWHYVALDAGHDAMISRPGAVADVLLGRE